MSDALTSSTLPATVKKSGKTAAERAEQARAAGRLGGRPRGSINKTTNEIRQLARNYGPDAVALLVKLAKSDPSGAVRVSACRELLDRGYGKSPQPLVGDGDNPVAAALVFTWLPPED